MIANDFVRGFRFRPRKISSKDYLFKEFVPNRHLRANGGAGASKAHFRPMGLGGAVPQLISEILQIVSVGKG